MKNEPALRPGQHLCVDSVPVTAQAKAWKEAGEAQAAQKLRRLSVPVCDQCTMTASTDPPVPDAPMKIIFNWWAPAGKIPESHLCWKRGVDF